GAPVGACAPGELVKEGGRPGTTGATDEGTAWWRLVGLVGLEPACCRLAQVGAARSLAPGIPSTPSLRACWSRAGLEPATHPCSRAALPTELHDHGHRTFGNAV